jgi:hypothetical protein
MAHGSDYEHKREHAVEALLTETSVEAAADKVGVSRRTLHRWLARPDFRRLYRRARADVLETAVARLQQAAGLAVDTLVKHLAAEKPGDSIRAADLILQHAMRGAELLDLAWRVEELERLLRGESDDGEGDEEPAGEDEGPGRGEATAG